MNKSKNSVIGSVAIIFGFALCALALYNHSRGIIVPKPQVIAGPFFCVIGLLVLRVGKARAAKAAGSA
jgi:hypothetical protein